MSGYGKKIADGIAASSTSYTISPAITRESAPQLLFFERGSYVPYLQDF